MFESEYFTVLLAGIALFPHMERDKRLIAYRFILAATLTSIIVSVLLSGFFYGTWLFSVKHMVLIGAGASILPATLVAQRRLGAMATWRYGMLAGFGANANSLLHLFPALLPHYGFLTIASHPTITTLVITVGALKLTAGPLANSANATDTDRRRLPLQKLAFGIVAIALLIPQSYATSALLLAMVVVISVLHSEYSHKLCLLEKGLKALQAQSEQRGQL